MKSLNILILDDEERVRNEIEEFLLEKKFTVYKSEAPSVALNLLKKNEIDILILDIKLPEMDGLQFLAKIKAEYPNIEVIMISGHGDMNTVIDAMRLGAADYFQKPFRLIDINNSIERTKRFVQINEKLKKVEKQFSFVSQELSDNIGQKLVGHSILMKNIIEIMTKVALVDNTTVLISGESGTGKELVARGIHYLSNRKEEFFYTVNCSAIPETLFESEFFGHKKGAFTGADADKSGCFEIANNGTLFLDEIGDMPLNQQAKLLRILDEKKVKKVGSHQEIDVDVRVITASNKNLQQLVKENKFRLDLFHRMTSFIIHLPPLSDRKSDIPLLLDHFIRYFSTNMGKHIEYTDPEIAQKLKNYPFPGNIRELKNMVERAMILCEKNELWWRDFEHFITAGIPGEVIESAKTAEPDSFNLEEVEKNTIIKALEKSAYNKAQAAELLNITWQALDRRMKKFGI